MDVPPSPDNRRWVRGLRPLVYWLLLVLVLFGIRTHQRLIEQTRLDFTVTLHGQPLFGAVTTLDGKPATGGQRISLGSHIFAVTHPKGETFSTNLLVWYGEHDLGTIDLKRTMGTLSVSADPPANWLVIRGPEWSVTLTNSSGLTQVVPTDVYDIEAGYPRWRQTYAASVLANQSSPCAIAPHFGGLNVSCNQADALYQLQTTDGQLLSDGLLPAKVIGLPAGSYKLMSTHHGHERAETVAVKADTTTEAQIDFQYGRVVFETSPAGVSVVADNGRSWGETPLTLVEMPPGTWTFTLRRNGYQPVLVALNVAANQTSYVSTNLVSETYLHALTMARQYMAAVDYDHAVVAAGDAFAARPGDVEAAILLREATGLGDLQRAQAMGKQGDYIGGGKELVVALRSLPDNAEIKTLLADFKQHEPEQIERERVERLNRPKTVYDAMLKTYVIANLFEDHELKTSVPAKDVAAAIVQSLETIKPTYKISANQSPKPETYYISAMQEDPGILTISGQRQCIIVCGQTTDTETVILFKVLEFKTKHNISMPTLGNFRDDEQSIPIHPSRFPDMTEDLKTRLQAGVSNLTARIQWAIAQNPVALPTAPQ
ncbi:MAG: PEGA domain-containing protein [Verrucomicrobiota bacterium]